MSEAPLDRDEFERWRREADHALEAARREAAAGAHNWACFLSEQAAQLAAKALLHGIAAGPRGHDLVRLAEAARAAGIEVPDDVRRACLRLSRLYIPTRYADAHPGGSPGSRYGAPDSADAIGDADLVLRWVDRSWHALDA